MSEGFTSKLVGRRALPWTSYTKADTLTVEELLFTATLYDDLSEKMRVYKLAAANYPQDWRGHNNVGYVYYMQNDLKTHEN